MIKYLIITSTFCPEVLNTGMHDMEEVVIWEEAKCGGRVQSDIRVHYSDQLRGIDP